MSSDEAQTEKVVVVSAPEKEELDIKEMFRQLTVNIQQSSSDLSTKLESKIEQNNKELSNNIEQSNKELSENLESKFEKNIKNLNENLELKIQQNNKDLSNKLETSLEQSNKELSENLESKFEKNIKDLNENLKLDIEQNMNALRIDIEKRADERQEITKADIHRTMSELGDGMVTLNERMIELESKIENQVRMKLDASLKSIEEKVEQNLGQVKDELYDRISGECVQSMNENWTPIRETITEVQNKIKTIQTTQTTERIQVVVNPNMYRADNEEKFYGDKKINPKVFMKNLKQHVGGLEDNIQMKKMIRGRLGGDAMLWFDIIEEDFQDIEEFEKIFLAYYWGQQTQSRVRENLFNGKYNETYGLTRQRYAMRQYSMAKQLEPVMLEQDIITHIARHFEEEICDVISIHEIGDIDRLLNYLRRIDDARVMRHRENRNYGQNNRYQEGGGRLGYNNQPRNYSYQNRGSYQNNNYRNNNNNSYQNNNYRNNNNNYNNEERRNTEASKENRYQNNKEANDKDNQERKNGQNNQNREYRPNYRSREYGNDRRYPSNERTYDNRNERFNSNLRRSTGRSPGRSPGRGSQENINNIRRTYGSPDNRERTGRSPIRQTENNDDRDNEQTKTRQVKFDEIAIIHDEPTDNKDF